MQNPEFIVAFPENSPPLLVSTEDPNQTVWLPENPEKDFFICRTRRVESRWFAVHPCSIPNMSLVTMHVYWRAITTQIILDMGKLIQNLHKKPQTKLDEYRYYHFNQYNYNQNQKDLRHDPTECFTLLTRSPMSLRKSSVGRNVSEAHPQLRTNTARGLRWL